MVNGRSSVQGPRRANDRFRSHDATPPAGGQISGATRSAARSLLHVLVRDALHTDDAPRCHSLDRQRARQKRSRPGATTGDCRGARRPPVCAGPLSSRTSACARRAASTAPLQRVRAGLVRLDRQGQRDIICSVLRRIEIDGDRIEVATPHEPLVPHIWAARYRRAHLGSGRSTGGGGSHARTRLRIGLASAPRNGKLLHREMRMMIEGDGNLIARVGRKRFLT